jgi:tRNA(Arg) A34 adenosine deaminase TadA
MKKTIIDLFEASVRKYGAKTFLLEKRHHKFEPTTYAETREQALEAGAGLAALGIRPGDKVAILAEGSNAWIISELGLFYAGAVSVPLSVKLEESNDLLFRMRHAEVKAMTQAARSLGTWNLADCTLIVTLEPCPMCAGACLQTHVGRIVFGAWDAKLGACGSIWDIPRDPHVGHVPEVIGGVRESECARLMTDFFAGKR